MMRILLMLSLVFQVAVGQEVQEYEVKGSVAKPGKVKWEKGVTLAGAIEAAGGLKDDAVVSRVTLIRNEKSYVYNFRNEAHQGIKIYARDVIEVKRSGAIRSGQALHIRITGVEKIDQARLDATYSVDPKGMLTMWKIGKVKAQGKTKAELAKELSAAYKKAGVFDAAVFQIFSDETVPDRIDFVTIGGQVRKPGQKIWQKGMTLSGAVKEAGGATPYAALNRVRLYRNGKRYQFDLTDRARKPVKVYPRDVIEVPELNVSPGR